MTLDERQRIWKEVQRAWTLPVYGKKTGRPPTLAWRIAEILRVDGPKPARRVHNQRLDCRMSREAFWASFNEMRRRMERERIA